MRTVTEAANEHLTIVISSLGIMHDPNTGRVLCKRRLSDEWQAGHA